jgi:hypothetical protein
MWLTYEKTRISLYSMIYYSPKPFLSTFLNLPHYSYFLKTTAQHLTDADDDGINKSFVWMEA